MVKVRLYRTVGVEVIHLRELCGKDELLANAINTQSLIALLQSVITDNNISAAKIVTSDRDRILAHLYISLYGPKIESTLPCTNCKEIFDLDFSLKDILGFYKPSTVELPPDGIFEFENGTRFRLPNGEDEVMLNSYAAADAERILFERCIIEGNETTDKQKLQEKMAELAPVLNLEIKACCPECNHEQNVKFDVQTYLLMKLKQERPRLLQEIHRIASQYHWDYQSILALPRVLRKQYVSMIESEI